MTLYNKTKSNKDQLFSKNIIYQTIELAVYAKGSKTKLSYTTDYILQNKKIFSFTAIKGALCTFL